MNKLLIIFLIFCSSLLKSQENLKPIDFIDINPLWQHIVIDSTRLNDTIYNGTKHLNNWGKSIFVYDSIGIFVFIDQSESLQGGYIEKINLHTGKTFWTNLFNIENSGKREYPSSIYLNNSGNLEILCFRSIQDVLPIGLWAKSQISIREYDFLTGKLLNHTYKSSVDLKPKEEIIFYFETTKLFKSDESIFIYLTPNIGSEKVVEYELKSFDSECNLNEIDTVKRNRLFPNGTTQTWAMYGRDTFINSRHSHMQSIFYDSITQENFDTFEYIVDFYSTDFEIIDTLNLKNLLPYNWSIQHGIVKNAKLLAIVSKDSVYLDNTYMAISYFDFQGNHYETLDFGKQIPKDLLIGKLPNQDGFLIVDRQVDGNIDNDRVIELKKSNGQGNIELIETITFEGGRYFGINSLDILKDNTIIIGLTLWVPDPVQPSASTYKTLYIVAIDGNELGLVKADNKISSYDKLRLYPNPAQSKLTIDFPVYFTGTLNIFTSDGKNVRSLDYQDVKIINIDISGFKNGFYFFNTLDEKGKMTYKPQSFVVE